jgi:hypothetical protein
MTFLLICSSFGSNLMSITDSLREDLQSFCHHLERNSVFIGAKTFSNRNFVVKHAIRKLHPRFFFR